VVTAEKRYWYLRCGLAQNSPRGQTDTETARAFQAKIFTASPAKRTESTNPRRGEFPLAPIIWGGVKTIPPLRPSA